MPTPTTYTYSILNDFPHGEVNTSKLHDEILKSSIVTALDSVNTAGDVLTIIFKDVLSETDKTTLDGNTTSPAGGLIAAHDNSPDMDVLATKFVGQDGLAHPLPLDSDGNLKITAQGRLGSKYNVISHNFCDKCSWYTGSVQIQDETLTDSGDHLTFNSSKTFWVDMKHGRITFEDNILAENPNKWISIIKVDGVTKIEDTDYTINPEDGTVTFNSSTTGTVTATFWYANTGLFIISPPANSKIELLRVEVQFSKTLVITDTISFQGYGYAGVFAPQYVPVPFGATQKIKLGAPLIYKTAMDYVNESNGVYPMIYPFGGDGWRGLKEETMILPWEYVTKTIIDSSAGMEIRLEMQNNTPFEGELAVITFYCVADSL